MHITVARQQLAALTGSSFVTPAGYARIGRLANIIARATGTTRAAVLNEYN